MSDYSRILVAYFSYSGVTKGIAEKVVNVTGADMFHIETVEPYSQVYKEVVKASQMELTSGKRPEITGHVENMNEYDTVLVGFPNWLSTCPTAVMTFLEQHNMKNKTILPFITHGGGGIGHAREDIEKSLGESVVTKKNALNYKYIDDEKLIEDKQSKKKK